MIAVGFFLATVATMVAWVIDQTNAHTPDWLTRAVGSAFLGGAVLLLCGVTRWLWIVTP